MPQPPDAILIAGPTASGKSAFALALAERGKGSIINADSMQIYSALRVLTARPSKDDEARAPHLLYGHVDADVAYSAGHYAKDAATAIAAVRAAGRVPIIVGGTGLYVKVLLEGLSPVPEIASDIRAKWRAAGANEPSHLLHQALAERDPVMAQRLEPGDRQRIVRALEVVEQTGRSLADWQGQPGTPVLAPDKVVKLVVSPPRDVLHARAEARFAGMLASGAGEEVRSLMDQGLDLGLPIMRALGVAPIRAWLGGEIDRQSALERGQAETRQYIKRQSTWLKKHMMSWKWLSTQQMERNKLELLMFIDN